MERGLVIDSGAVIGREGLPLRDAHNSDHTASLSEHGAQRRAMMAPKAGASALPALKTWALPAHVFDLPALLPSAFVTRVL